MRPNSRDGFTIAIICALTVEAEAVEEHFDEIFDRLGKLYGKHPMDVNAYINGRIGVHNVVLAYMPEMGKTSAARVASSVPFSYPNIEIGLVVGICGGAPRSPGDEDIFLGDVVISDAVMEYDFGEQYPSGFQRQSDIKNILGNPDSEIRNILTGIKASDTRRKFQDQLLQHLHRIQQSSEKWTRPRFTDDVVFNPLYHHKHHDEASSVECLCSEGNHASFRCKLAATQNCTELGCHENQINRRRDSTKPENISIHIGTVGSASTVMKSGEDRDQLVKTEQVLGVEMEGAGVWDIFPCIIIKGVCDYADSHKNKIWQAYAAATGSCAAKTFLEYWRPVATGG
ncbi:Pfs, NB-ARC and TPR domain protein [Aspergillus taichungensis]|uniref:Pfs, NB-ARC and TPR domain protein n=1 Tax=Aspergillus taichungensis TaxID=482145 RepID=A0A2J5I960_9EURO|nr:Pfs, NB-ARC and TPR domain protein [Aspergillus taichungensis]